MDNSVAITLFRHGMTEANVRKEYLGWNDSPLLQSEQIRLGKISATMTGYEQIYCSDLPRCEKTAAILFPMNTPIKMKELREMNFGSWEGRAYQNLVNEPSYQHFLVSPFEAIPLNGESFPVFSARVQRGWNRVLEDMKFRGARQAAVVTHGGVIRALLSKFAVENKEFWEWATPHANGYQLIWKSLEAARRDERCNSLQAVPTMAKRNG